MCGHRSRGSGKNVRGQKVVKGIQERSEIIIGRDANRNIVIGSAGMNTGK
jgi:hypothetical protein